MINVRVIVDIVNVKDALVCSTPCMVNFALNDSFMVWFDQCTSLIMENKNIHRLYFNGCIGEHSGISRTFVWRWNFTLQIKESVYAWLLMARHLDLHKDVARYIGTMLLDDDAYDMVWCPPQLKCANHIQQWMGKGVVQRMTFPSIKTP